MSNYDLPATWSTAIVRDIVRDISYGHTASAKTEPVGVKFLRITDIQNGRVNWNTVPYCECSDIQRKKYKLSVGDIVFARTGATTGKSYLIKQDVGAVFASYLIRLQVADGILPEYLAYFFQSNAYWQQITTVKKGSAQPGVNATILGQLSVPIAPINQQKQIVEEIDIQFARLDQAVAGLKRVQVLCKQYRASLLKAACEGRLVPQDAEDEPADILLQRILIERRTRWEVQAWQKEIIKAQQKAAKATRKQHGNPLRKGEKLGRDEWESLPEAVYAPYLPKNETWKEKYKEPVGVDAAGLPDLPSGWVWASTDQISVRIVDCLHSTPKFKETGFNCVDTNSIKPSRIVHEKIRYVDEETFHDRNRRMIPQLGDVMFSREGALLGVAVVVPDNFAFCLGQRMMIFRLADDLDSHYFECVLNSLVFRLQYMPKISGSASPHVNIGDIRQFGIPLPSVNQQKQIASKIDQLTSLLDEVEKQVARNLKRAERLRQSILNKAFRGALVPQHPDDDPASTLLAHIRANNPT